MNNRLPFEISLLKLASLLILCHLVQHSLVNALATPSDATTGKNEDVKEMAGDFKGRESFPSPDVDSLKNKLGADAYSIVAKLGKQLTRARRRKKKLKRYIEKRKQMRADFRKKIVALLIEIDQMIIKRRVKRKIVFPDQIPYWKMKELGKILAKASRHGKRLPVKTPKQSEAERRRNQMESELRRKIAVEFRSKIETLLASYDRMNSES